MVLQMVSGGSKGRSGCVRGGGKREGGRGAAEWPMVLFFSLAPGACLVLHEVPSLPGRLPWMGPVCLAPCLPWC